VSKARLLSRYLCTRKDVFCSDDQRELLEDFVAEWRGWKITAKAGFKTDGASIPRLFWRVVGHPWGHFLPAAVFHDLLYETERFPRPQADRCFLDLLEALDVPWVQRHAMYASVRLGGGVSWTRHSDESIYRALHFLEVEAVA
jgi:hypothetical protein